MSTASRLFAATAALLAISPALDQPTTAAPPFVTTAAGGTQPQAGARPPATSSSTAHDTMGDGNGSPARLRHAGPTVEPDSELTQPHTLHGQLADLIVRVKGARACSGTPITGTRFIVTAAHCLLDADGVVVEPVTVLRDGVEYQPVSVLLDPRYHDSPSTRSDAAVMVMAQTIPGLSATLGDQFPTEGQLTIVGFQPLDTDGSLLRGTDYSNQPLPHAATGGIVYVEWAVAGCVHQAAQAVISNDDVRLPCGLVPGASGGGAILADDGKLILVGITSTVARDLSFNGLTPLSAVHELLDNPVRYTHDVTSPKSRPSRARIFRS